MSGKNDKWYRRAEARGKNILASAPGLHLAPEKWERLQFKQGESLFSPLFLSFARYIVLSILFSF